MIVWRVCTVYPGFRILNKSLQPDRPHYSEQWPAATGWCWKCWSCHGMCLQLWNDYNTKHTEICRFWYFHTQSSWSILTQTVIFRWYVMFELWYLWIDLEVMHLLAIGHSPFLSVSMSTHLHIHTLDLPGENCEERVWETRVGNFCGPTNKQTDRPTERPAELLVTANYLFIFKCIQDAG